MKSLHVALLAMGIVLLPSLASATWPERGRYNDKPSWKHERPHWDNHRGPDFHNKYSYNNHNSHNHYSQKDRNDFGRGRYQSPNNFGDTAIKRGIQSGRLSNNEIKDLQRDKSELYHKERAYLSDGRLTKREREDLHDERQDYYQQLEHQLNDGERRW